MDEEETKDEKTYPLDVKIINKDKPNITPYTETDNENYDNINITPEEIDEFVEGKDTGVPSKEK